MNSLTVLCVSGMLGFCAAGALAAPAGGMFIPRNGGHEGRIGEAHVFIDSTAGGAMEVVTGEWPGLSSLARVEMVFAVRKEGEAETVEVRQSFDRNPEIVFLEEGNARIGVRVKCKLYDKGHLYHGYGMTETWMYPNGEMFVTVAAAFEDPLAHTAVTDAGVVVELSDRYSAASVGADPVEDVELASLAEPRQFSFSDEALPGRHVLLSGDGRPPLGLYWRTGKMAHDTFVYRGGKGAPTYHRWPAYLPQAFAYGSGSAPKAVELGAHSLQLRWPPRNGARPVFEALFRIAALDDPNALGAYVEAERSLAKLGVEGGAIHGSMGGYNDQEGAYEVRKSANPMTVTLPADATGRIIRIKAIALKGCGAVVATLNGQPVVPHLSSDGGIADDPLAPIREHPEGPADMAVVTAKLAEEPQTLTLSEEPGVQFAYQARDPWRNVACFTSKGGGRHSGFKFSLVDGRARNMRGYAKREWALTENLLTWFSFCGFTPEHMVDQLTDFQVLKNGPDEAILRYVSTNANGRARSEYLVHVPADSPAMQMNVTATFRVAEGWPYGDCQFFDVFPFRGVEPEDWWYDEVLWLTPDGRVKTMRTVEQTYDGDTELSTISGGGFFALYSSDRGNMLMLTKNFKPELPASYVICGNYIDFHMDVQFIGEDGKPRPPEKGFQASVQYDLAIWGDENTTRQELIGIGKESIKAGRLALPDR